MTSQNTFFLHAFCFLSKVIYCSLEINPCNCYMLIYSSSWAFLYSSTAAYWQILFQEQTPVTNIGLVFVLCSSLELALGKRKSWRFSRAVAPCCLLERMPTLGSQTQRASPRSSWSSGSSKAPAVLRWFLGMENSSVWNSRVRQPISNVLLPSWHEDVFTQQKIQWKILNNLKRETLFFFRKTWILKSECCFVNVYKYKPICFLRVDLFISMDDRTYGAAPFISSARVYWLGVPHSTASSFSSLPYSRYLIN